MDRFECQSCHVIVTADADVEDHKQRHGLIINIGPVPEPATYYLQVDVDDARPETHYRNVYKGSSVPDAMAAWSKAIAEGAEYVMLEALKEHPKEA